ncbi:MAG: site-specific DNA-methyltransferase [Treponema sp.]|nr:site-specific DNA-methyltransferase [Treponema sp.]
MELVYPGKKPREEILNGTVSCPLEGQLNGKNILIKGDNLTVLQSLLKNHQCAGTVDLIYIDPPFATNTVFTIGEERVRTVSMSGTDAVAYRDNLKCFEFIEFIRERLIVARELLSDTGSIYVQSDYKIGHYIKIIMDEVFGIDNFRNDITRIKCNPKNFDRKAYGNIKDMLLFYSKTKEIIWNDPTTALSENDKKRLFKKTDKNGRAYTTVPLHAPGETKNGLTSTAFKGMKPPKGRHWRCDPQELEALDGAGLIEWSPHGNPRKIIYADERDGKKLQDIWEFKDSPYPVYPTEKNLKLIKTIIAASSHEGSVVLDFFCGSGTTLVAAQELHRNWIGIDKSEKAIKVTREKLKNISNGLLSDAGYSYREV